MHLPINLALAATELLCAPLLAEAHLIGLAVFVGALAFANGVAAFVSFEARS